MLETFNRVMRCTWRIDFIGAIVCGFCMGGWVEAVRDDEGFVLRNFVEYVLLDTASYGTAALLLIKWDGKLRCAIGWLVVLFLGGAISFFSIAVVESVNYGQRFMGDAWLSFVVERCVEWTLAGVILPLPIMLIVRLIYIVTRHWRQKSLARVA